MKQLKPLESIIFTIRNHKVIIDADLAALDNVPTRALNQAVKRNEDRFPRDFVFRLTAKERLEVVTHCDHLARLKFSRTLPLAFTEHGAIIVANAAILKRLAQIDRALLEHDSSLLDLYEKLLPLLQPPPGSPTKRIGFQSKGKA